MPETQNTTGFTRRELDRFASDQEVNSILAATSEVFPLEISENERITQKLALILEDAVCQASAITGSSGAAIALLEEDAMLCVASYGDAAPPLGATVNVRNGLSGECVR